MLLLVLLLVVVVSAGSEVASETSSVTRVDDEALLYRRLPVYGAPLQGVRYGDQPSDGLVHAEAMGWRSIYDAPFMIALQQDGKNEIAGFFVKDGLRSLPQSEDMRFLHTIMLTGLDKVGVLLSGTNYVSLPQVDMPITRFVLPRRFSLADSARLHADFYSFPTLLIVNRENVNPRDLVRLAMVGEFTVLPDSVKVSQDVPAPAAKWSKRFMPGYMAVSQGNKFGPGGFGVNPVDLALSGSFSANPLMSRFF